MAYLFPALSGKNNLIEENFQQKQQRDLVTKKPIGCVGNSTVVVTPGRLFLYQYNYITMY